jgi:two-component system nitrogen regulation sensor histidine kinase GlnL
MSRSPTSPARCAELLEAINTAVLLLDGALHLSYLNPAAENMLEISRRQAVGQALPDIVQAGAPLISRVQEALQSQSSFTERELELRSAISRRRITVDCVITPLSEQEVLLEVMQLDHHLRIAHEELLLSQQQAARELLRGLAHEIKNPLGGLRGAAQLLESELTQPELKEYTQVIIGEADRLRNLVNRLLGPNNVPVKQPVSIHEILEHVRSLVGVEHAGLDIERRYDPSIPDLLADSELLVQVFLNLLRNAAEAGARRIQLRTRTERQFTIGHNRYKLVLRVDVIDDGSGIAAELREKIFYPMVTGRAEGTGLGLSLAQSMINQHQGIIEFTSAPGSTMFTVFLPLEVKNDGA